MEDQQCNKTLNTLKLDRKLGLSMLLLLLTRLAVTAGLPTVAVRLPATGTGLPRGTVA